MRTVLASYTTAAALLGAGIIAVTPVAAPPPDIDAVRGVALTVDSVQDNLTNIWNAATFQGGNQEDFLNPLATTFTLDSLHDVEYQGLTGQIPDYPYAGFADLQDFVQFLASPLSGALIGMLGPLLSPVVALMNGDDPVTAFFDGATLNLEPYIDTFKQLGLANLPAGIEIDKLDFHFGGLFTPGQVQGTGETVPVDGPFPPGEASGGSILNSVGFAGTASYGSGPDAWPTEFDFTGQAVGPFGGLAALYGSIASVIGWPEPPEVPNVPDVPDLSGLAALVG
ncbi:MAG: outer membrane porin GjpA [Mycobacterium sp.]